MCRRNNSSATSERGESPPESDLSMRASGADAAEFGDPKAV
jgi:hypothetical protein